MLKTNKTFFLFLLRALGIFLLWGVLYSKWLAPNGTIDSLLIRHLILFSAFILKITGYAVFTESIRVGISGTSGVIISSSCDGLSLFVLFAGFIIAFPGGILSKIVFIPIGILIIDLLNIVRISALVLMVKYSPQSLAFNHSYTFTLIMYLIIFGMWIFWINQLSGKAEVSG